MSNVNLHSNKNSTLPQNLEIQQQNLTEKIQGQCEIGSKHSFIHLCSMWYFYTDIFTFLKVYLNQETTTTKN